MAANAEDLALFYSTALGDTTIVAASTSVASVLLAPGRYRVRYRAVAGAATIWARAGEDNAAAAAPSTPFDVALFNGAGGEMFLANIRGGSSKKLSFITDAGTASIVITKISR